MVQPGVFLGGTSDGSALVRFADGRSFRVEASSVRHAAKGYYTPEVAGYRALVRLEQGGLWSAYAFYNNELAEDFKLAQGVEFHAAVQSIVDMARALKEQFFNASIEFEKWESSFLGKIDAQTPLGQQ